MRRLILLVGAITAVAALVAQWRRDRRIGAKFMNEIVNPRLVAGGASGVGRSEIGTLEHIGRKSGTRRLTPVHPGPARDGFHIVVPLAEQSEWARNVLTAGHCRLQLHDTVYELDEPVLCEPRDVPELSSIARTVGSVLGVKYLRLHTFSSRPGALEPLAPAIPAEPGAPAAPANPDAVPAH
jgi:hypothetical protein